MSEIEKRERSRQKQKSAPGSKPFRNEGETASARDFEYDLEACPPSYNQFIWDLVQDFKKVATLLEFRLRTNDRLAYALLKRSLTESNLMQVKGVEEFVGAEVFECKLKPPTAERPTWTNITRIMMKIFWEDMVNIGREAYAWEQFCGEAWEECLNLVVQKCVTYKLLETDPEEPDKPRYRASRQPMHPGRPRKGIRKPRHPRLPPDTKTIPLNPDGKVARELARRRAEREND